MSGKKNTVSRKLKGIEFESSVVLKKYNIKAIWNKHSSFDQNYMLHSELRKSKISDLKAKLASQQLIFTNPLEKASKATTASFEITHVLTKKSCQDGDLIKKNPHFWRSISF
jgi:hypothetical protein